MKYFNNLTTSLSQFSLLIIMLIPGLVGCDVQVSQNTTVPPNLNKPVTQASPLPQARQTEPPADVSEVVTSIIKLKKAGESMQSLRKDANLAKCGELMRKYRKEVEALEPKAQALPKLYSTYLHPAVIELKTCTTCISSAYEACIRVDTNISDLTERLLEK
jgi:hypothetical protein